MYFAIAFPYQLSYNIITLSMHWEGQTGGTSSMYRSCADKILCIKEKYYENNVLRSGQRSHRKLLLC